MMSLTIPEGIALLSLKNETGEKQGQFVEYGLAGSAIAELILRGQLVPDELKPKKLNIADTSTTGDAFLDFCMSVLLNAGSGKSVKSYVNKLAGKSRLFREQALSLVAKGVLRADPKSFLVFNWTHYPEADPDVEAALTGHLSSVMFREQAPEARDCVIIALAEKTGLLRKNFDKSLLKENRKRIKEISKGGMEASKATIEAIEAVQAALIAATTVATVGATSG
ncbi:MAG: GPP34 family phosphoprotein [Henriciella sp.]|uniref:GOLPH3/VPS74 family protein n=1 Tax=Henriciella sp. TaxID=1968823 RepID=UPI0032EAFAFC